MSLQINRVLEWLLATVGAVNCIVVPSLFAGIQQVLFPLPGLYFIEIALSGLLAIIAVAAQQDSVGRWSAAPWLSAGALMAFVILGGFSIGFYLIPATVAFLITGILVDRRVGGDIGKHAGLMVVVAVAQGALMLLLTLFS